MKKCSSIEITVIVERVALESSPGERFWEDLTAFFICIETELLVHWLVLLVFFFVFSLFSFFALHGGDEPHYSCETLRGDVIQPQMARGVMDELRMVLLASYQMYKLLRGFVMNSQHS